MREGGRRRFLRQAMLLGAAAFVKPPAVAKAVVPRFTAPPFALGVASGWPRPASVVLWTRLAPQPLDGGGMDPVPVEVRWEVAADEKFSNIVRRGTVVTDAQHGHAVHAEVEGLVPSRWYHYRFLAGGEVSPAGRTRTAPAPAAKDERLRLAFASCQNFEHAHFSGHRALAAEAPDLVQFLGDYIYESRAGRSGVRQHRHATEVKTIDQYRERYAQYKLDPDLQGAHAAAPWIAIWDDHEVENDYANDRSQTLDPEFLTRRAAAYRAWLEHLPVPRSVRLEGGGVRLHDRLHWGALACVHLLDGRQHRSHQSCPRENRGGSHSLAESACEARLDPARTFFGPEQEEWLDGGLAASRSQWNLVAQPTLVAGSTYPDADRGRIFWSDGWDGYPAARERLLASLSRPGLGNPVVLSGDVHANFVANLHRKHGDATSPVVATELCGTSIASRGMATKLFEKIRAGNPGFVFADGAKRGYGMLEITSRRAEVRLRAIDAPGDPASTVSTLASFVIEDGKPGAKAA